MSNPNFVNDLVMMAKAFEELPKVQAELDTAKHDINGYLATIQRLELRLIDRAQEIDSLNAKVRTVEVERDHAETMFLETDDKLQSLRGIFTHFQTEVDAFTKVSEPVPEPVAEPQAEVNSAPEPVSVSPDPTVNTLTPTDASSPSGPAASTGAESTGSVSIQPSEGASATPPTDASSWATDTLELERVPAASAVSGESAASLTTPADAPEVASPSDPTPATESSSESGSPGWALPDAAQ